MAALVLLSRSAGAEVVASDFLGGASGRRFDGLVFVRMQFARLMRTGRGAEQMLRQRVIDASALDAVLLRLRCE